MKKLRLKILICSMILVASISFAGLKTQNPTYAQVTPYKYATGLDTSYVCETDDNILTKVELKEVGVTLPQSYDLRDEISIRVSNQDQYTICYAFASMTMLETYIAKAYNEYYNFSEIHMVTSKFVDDGENNPVDNPNTTQNDIDLDVDFNQNGGSFYNFYSYTTKGFGPVLEEEMPFSTFYTSSSTYATAYENAAEEYYINNSSNFSKILNVERFIAFADATTLNADNKITNRNLIKEHITNYGSCVANIKGNSSYFHTSGGKNYLSMNASNYSADHMISIIGWDDSYQAPDWTNPGGYLCLNSWGSYYDYFYVSYDDANIEDSVYGIIDVKLNSNTHRVSNTTDLNEYNVSLYTYTPNTPTQIYTTVIDVSDHLNSYIDKLGISLQATSNYLFKLGFTNTPSKSAMSLVVSSSDISYTSSTSVGKNGGYPTGDLCTIANLNTPIKITGNYAILVVAVSNSFSFQAYSAPGSSSDFTKNTYYSSSFDSFSDGVNRLIIPVFLNISTFSDTQSNYISTVAPEVISKLNGFNFKNASFLHNTLTYTISSPTDTIQTTDVSINAISISTPTLNINHIQNTITTIPSLTLTDKKNCFTITIDDTNADEISVHIRQINTLPVGMYRIQFNIGDKIYQKIFEVLTSGPTYDISYNLNEGTNNRNNAQVYLLSDDSLKLYKPTRAGFDFVSWYSDELLSQEITGTTGNDSFGNYILYTIPTPKNDLTFYAKWQLSAPTIITQPINVSKAYNGMSNNCSFLVEHPLATVSNLITYQWYYGSSSDTLNTISLTTNTLSVMNVADSGFYKCVASFTNGITVTATSNIIQVSITKGTYNIGWNYTSSSPYSYDNTLKTVGLTNLGNYGSNIEVTSLINNTATQAGDYVASVTLNNKNVNYNDLSLPDLSWKIEKANLIVNINDVSVSNEIEFSTCTDFSYTLVGTIFDSYDLNLNYSTQSTTNENLKTITATYSSNLNYNVTINNAYLRLVRYTLSSTIEDTTVKISSIDGFVIDAELTITKLLEQDLSLQNQKFLEDHDLTVYDIIRITVNDVSANSNNEISISLPNALKDKNVKVYRITSEGLELVGSKIKNNNIILNSEDLGDFIIVEAPEKTELKTLIISLSIILGCALLCCVVITIIKHRRKSKYV